MISKAKDKGLISDVRKLNKRARRFSAKSREVFAESQRDTDLYHFVHDDGVEEVDITRSEMVDKYPELLAKSLSKIITGKRISLKGWRLEKHRDLNMKEYRRKRQSESHRFRDDTLHTFQHDNGKKITSTRRQMLIDFPSLSKGPVRRLVSGDQKTHKGWRLAP